MKPLLASGATDLARTGAGEVGASPGYGSSVSVSVEESSVFVLTRCPRAPSKRPVPPTTAAVEEAALNEK